MFVALIHNFWEWNKNNSNEILDDFCACNQSYTVYYFKLIIPAPDSCEVETFNQKNQKVLTLQTTAATLLVEWTAFA